MHFRTCTLILGCSLIIGLASRIEASRPHDTGLVLLLGVSRPTFVTGKRCHEIVVTLFLENHGREAAYVSPVMGQMASTLKILARRSGTRDEPVLLYSSPGGRPGFFDLGDLFKLLPERALEFQLRLPYPVERLPAMDGHIEIWAEYDFRAMKSIQPDAAGAILKSDPEIADIKFAN
jgi:hypothetical protein